MQEERPERTLRKTRRKNTEKQEKRLQDGVPTKPRTDRKSTTEGEKHAMREKVQRKGEEGGDGGDF
jgi:hypothetical protein